ncbi:MAG: type II toxin-antitoxin system VapC family toxin [Gemmatimonadetes bacterium]|nr:type II toxin-antitoxin system VapC family toxin [Gemmatimonadota bacterium]MCZ6825376.1 type II toxin-antitoxin system VapC family toxin [Gemmatimonadota bacterium]
MSLVVVDASSLAAVLFGEPRSREVEERLRGAVMVTPTLLPYELGNTCLKKIAQDPDRRSQLLEALSYYSRMEIQEIEVPPLEVTPMAEATKLSFYDASYLWLSRSLGAPLVTLDRRLEDAASGPN